MIREHFLPLPLYNLVQGATLYRPTQRLPERVTLESSALVRCPNRQHLEAPSPRSLDRMVGGAAR